MTLSPATDILRCRDCGESLRFHDGGLLDPDKGALCRARVVPCPARCEGAECRACGDAGSVMRAHRIDDPH